MDLAKINQRKALAKQGGGDRLELKEGPNNIRVFGFHHVVTEADVKKGLYERSKIGKKEFEIDRPVVIHFGVDGVKQPVLSNPKLIAKYEQVLAAKGKEVANKIGPQSKFAMNVLDTDEKPRKVRHFLMPKTVYNKILKAVANPDYALGGVLGGTLFGSKGRDFVITVDPKKSGSERYDVQVRDKEHCVVLNSEMDTKVKDFFGAEGWKALGILDQSAAPVEEEPAAEEAAEEETGPVDGETPEAEGEAVTEPDGGTEDPAPAEEPAEETSEEAAPAEEEPMPEEEPAEEPPKPVKKAAPAPPAKKPAAKPAPVAKGKKPARERD